MQLYPRPQHPEMLICRAICIAVAEGSAWKSADFSSEISAHHTFPGCFWQAYTSNRVTGLHQCHPKCCMSGTDSWHSQYIALNLGVLTTLGILTTPYKAGGSRVSYLCSSLMRVPGPNSTNIIAENCPKQPSLTAVCKLVIATAFFIVF